MSTLLKIYEENPSQRYIDKVVLVLKQGGIIIYPTDTVYGLGCDITNVSALKKIAQIKKIKLEKANLSFICADLKDLSNYTLPIENNIFRILKSALPGPYTFILKGSNTLPKTFKKKKTVGIRVPKNNIVKSLVEMLGNPIVSTSIHDKDTIKDYTTDPELIFDEWKHLVDIVVDGGVGGIEPSTVIDLTDGEPQIVRKGKGETDFLQL